MMWGSYLGMGLNWLFVSLVVIGIVVLIIVLIRLSATNAPRSETPQQVHDIAAANSARQILDERFARGELDIDEYRERRAALDDK